MEKEVQKWAALLHISQLAGYFIPLAGFIVPIVIWQVKKDELPTIDRHGRQVTNWIITQFIYSCIGVVLIFVFLIGVPLLMILGLLVIVFPIIGAIKAADGDFWQYPLTIQFL